jgi:hypothetical protein
MTCGPERRLRARTSPAFLCKQQGCDPAAYGIEERKAAWRRRPAKPQYRRRSKPSALIHSAAAGLRPGLQFTCKPACGCTRSSPGWHLGTELTAHKHHVQSLRALQAMPWGGFYGMNCVLFKCPLPQAEDALGQGPYRGT